MVRGRESMSKERGYQLHKQLYPQYFDPDYYNKRPKHPLRVLLEDQQRELKQISVWENEGGTTIET